MAERKTNKLCPECDEEYLVEVREPGVSEPIEIYCPACGFTAEPEEVSDEEEEEGEELEEYDEEIDGIEIDEEEDD